MQTQIRCLRVRVCLFLVGFVGTVQCSVKVPLTGVNVLEDARTKLVEVLWKPVESCGEPDIPSYIYIDLSLFQ